jgi:hypothetical protein
LGKAFGVDDVEATPLSFAAIDARLRVGRLPGEGESGVSVAAVWVMEVGWE